MRRIEKPWGWEDILIDTELYVVKRIYVAPGQRLSRQYHNEKDETIFVEDGYMHLDLSTTDDENNILVLGENRSYRIKPGTVHRFTAPKDSGVTVLEASTPHLDDVVRLSDDYGRADA